MNFEMKEVQKKMTNACQNNHLTRISWAKYTIYNIWQRVIFCPTSEHTHRHRHRFFCTSYQIFFPYLWQGKCGKNLAYCFKMAQINEGKGPRWDLTTVKSSAMVTINILVTFHFIQVLEILAIVTMVHVRNDPLIESYCMLHVFESKR